MKNQIDIDELLEILDEELSQRNEDRRSGDPRPSPGRRLSDLTGTGDSDRRVKNRRSPSDSEYKSVYQGRRKFGAADDEPGDTTRTVNRRRGTAFPATPDEPASRASVTPNSTRRHDADSPSRPVRRGDVVPGGRRRRDPAESVEEDTVLSMDPSDFHTKDPNRTRRRASDKPGAPQNVDNRSGFDRRSKPNDQAYGRRSPASVVARALVQKRIDPDKPAKISRRKSLSTKRGDISPHGLRSTDKPTAAESVSEDTIATDTKMFPISDPRKKKRKTDDPKTPRSHDNRSGLDRRSDPNDNLLGRRSALSVVNRAIDALDAKSATKSTRRTKRLTSRGDIMPTGRRRSDRQSIESVGEDTKLPIRKFKETDPVTRHGSNTKRRSSDQRGPGSSKTDRRFGVQRREKEASFDVIHGRRSKDSVETRKDQIHGLPHGRRRSFYMRPERDSARRSSPGRRSSDRPLQMDSVSMDAPHKKYFAMVHAVQSGRMPESEAPAGVRLMANALGHDDVQGILKKLHTDPTFNVKKYLLYSAPTYSVKRKEKLLRAIAQSKKAGELNGEEVDNFSAFMISRVLDKLEDDQKLRLLKKPVREITAISYKLAARTEF